MAASKMVMASLIHRRPLTCAAAVTASYPSRLVPHPPDLIKWVRREGGFVHEAVKISQEGNNGFGLIASQAIPKGSELIVLPDHIPLKFGPLEYENADGATSVLINLAQKVPGMYLSLFYDLVLFQILVVLCLFLVNRSGGVAFELVLNQLCLVII